MIEFIVNNWQLLSLELFFAILGALVGALIALFRESKARPNLTLEAGSIHEGNYKELGAPNRFLHLKIKNQPWPKWWQTLWYGNRPALFCKTKLEFIDPQVKTTIFAFQARWTSAPEPIVPSERNLNKGRFDPSRAIAAEMENILPFEEKELSVALKVDDKDEFYGFNNWSYVWPQWRNPDWVVHKGSVLLKVNLWWDSGKLEKCFVISNEQKTIKSFHIEDYPNEKCL